MPFTLENLGQIRRGYICQVGQLPDGVAQRLGWRCPYVYLGPGSLEHIARDHSDVTDFDLLYIPLAIRDGIIVQDAERKRSLLVGYRPSDDPPRFYRSVLKEAQSGTEIWVSTFHRIRETQFDNLIKKGPTLRKHK